jgi:hypothetical protein
MKSNKTMKDTPGTLFMNGSQQSFEVEDKTLIGLGMRKEEKNVAASYVSITSRSYLP